MPFIAVTAGEGGLEIPKLVPGADGWIQHASPGPYDRYPDMEVLLARTVGTVPSGAPDGNVLSPYRQTHCVLNRLCQGCGEPAERGPQGALYVLPATRADGSEAAFSGVSDMPPSCARCAFRRCPVLSSRGRRLLWVRQAEVIGVYAEVFLPHRRGYCPETLVLLDDERTLSASVATRTVCDLRQVSDADPRHIKELAGLARRPVPEGRPHGAAALPPAELAAVPGRPA
ncbi:hypothetical protein ACIQWZ_18795 [Streptomyces sp. NPDC098077]|uniref:hypothetical protein n=1 Tax=Streptomyces sp. NPDC098077 TaxID=3366093 RepID=UPI003826B881